MNSNARVRSESNTNGNDAPGFLASNTELTPPDSSSTEKISAVRATLLEWFAVTGRDLPWRRTRDPYRILVSEVMLQQTQVDRVIPYYEAFLERFPTAEALATGSAAEVLRLWSGLGYNRRAINLQRTVQCVIDRYDGVWPRTIEELRKLPGIGPYTAGALRAFAFEEDAAFLDTNMRRVIHRVFVGPDAPAATVPERELLAVAELAVPSGQSWTWNQALIEFGALVCTARKPVCVVCPLQQQCNAFPAILGILQSLPAGTRKKQEASFAGSNRYYRGRIVESLIEGQQRGEGLSLQSLGYSIREDFKEADLPWLRGIVDGLARDGLAVLAEESGGYDAGAFDPGSAMVKLPD